VLSSRLVSPGKSDGGSAFRSSRRDTLIGNPRDPLIGFPIIFVLQTDNSELTTGN
jgi:hypothetical protein